MNMLLAFAPFILQTVQLGGVLFHVAAKAAFLNAKAVEVTCVGGVGVDFEQQGAHARKVARWACPCVFNFAHL